MTIVRVAVSLIVLTAAATHSAAQTYLPVGPQTNVDIATVVDGGWFECYSEPYDAATGEDLAEIQSRCAGDRMMLACGPSGETTLTLLAQATRTQAFTNPGTGTTDSHLANGAQWYFDASGGEDDGESSWGFAAQGETVQRNNCDVAGTQAESRLCWHMQPAEGGYRCGTTLALNESATWTKYVYTNVQPVPVASPWQIAVIAVLLSLAAARVVRYRRMHPTTL
jgi:hypothetical protein